MGILDASVSSGGSQNSGYNISQSQSQSNSAGIAASNASATQAQIARDWQAQQTAAAMAFNATEAQKQREWEEKMANTIYTRSVKDMKAAGINPILAANFGLSAAGVGSGATASISAPSGFMGQSFPEVNSASQSYGYGENQGSSWNSSESGLATFIGSMAGIFETISQGLSSGLKLDVGDSFDRLYNKLFPEETQTPEDKEVKKSLSEATKEKSNTEKKKYKGNNHDYSGGLPKTGARDEKVIY